MNGLSEVKKIIESGKAVLGIELGSTRIKAVLVDQRGSVIETGGFDWENSLIDGVWTYSLKEVWEGIQKCYKNLSERLKERYDVKINKLSAMGVSAMMHGYLPFDKNGNQLAEFRTWRNNFTGQAADELTQLFQYNIPQRWSIAHLYQAILNNVPGVDRYYKKRITGKIDNTKTDLLITPAIGSYAGYGSNAPTIEVQEIEIQVFIGIENKTYWRYETVTGRGFLCTIA